jgi:septum formation protein
VNAPPPEIILASGSPRRRELLGKLGVRFEVVTADVEELMPATTRDPRNIAQHNAKIKAQAVANVRPGRWILGADTIVVLGERLLGKPPTLAAAHEYLAALSGHTHEVITGCCLIDPDPKEDPLSFSDTSRVTFHDLSAETIANYLTAVHVLDKAGGYALQEHGDWLVAGIEGSRDNILGLPTERLRSLLVRRGLL